MSVSRRDFFVSAFGKAVNHISNIIPTPMHKLLGIATKPVSAEEAAFLLTRSPRKPSSKSIESQ